MANISHQKARSLILLASQATLAPRDQQTLDAHLETCGACKAYVQTLAATQQKLSRSLHRRWDPLRARVSIQQIQTGSRRTLMFKKLTITAGTLAVVVVMALIVFSISGSLSPKKMIASNITATPTRVVATAAPTAQQIHTPIQLGPTNTMSIADWSPDGKRLIIRKDGDQLLYVVNRDGSGLIKLPIIARSAQWSADGSSIQICLNPPETPKTRKIFSVSPDGSNLKEVPDNEKVSTLLEGNCEPTLSSDGMLIAFTQSHEFGLYFMGTDGENIRKVVNGAETDILIHQFKRDAFGTSLIYSSIDLSNGDSRRVIYELKFDATGFPTEGKSLAFLTDAENASFGTDSISPDGQKAIYVPHSPTGIYTSSFRTTAGWTKIADVSPPNGFEYSPLWSPDGSQIAFMGFDDNDNDVFVVNADGSNLRSYPNPASNDQLLAWSPDGLSLVFLAQAEPAQPPYTLYLVDVKDMQPVIDLRTITGPGACVLAPAQYLVAEGDVLDAIAARFNVSAQSIISLNNLDAIGTIVTGQKLLIPQVPSTLVDGVNYTVAKNDTLDSIAATFGTSAEGIREINYLDSAGTISTGQMLIIPQAGHVPLISNDMEMNISIRWPLTSHSILAQDYSTLHPGLDIVANAGDPVRAGQSGVVIFAGVTDGPLGNAIIIQHRNQMETVYAHLGELHVSCLESVSASQVIGTVGQPPSGAASPFLYFAIRKDGDPATPQMFLVP